MLSMRIFAPFVCLALFGGGACLAQTAEAPQATSKDRLFFGMPNYLTLESTDHVPPLSTKEKFKVTVKGAFDPFEYFWYGARAGISQLGNTEPGYGQGMEGYAKRYGAFFADGTIQNVMAAAVMPTLLKQDPRYYQLGHGGFWKRAAYAASRVLVTRSDAGGGQFNWSEVLGSAGAAGISTFTYHPKGDRNLGNAMTVWGSQVGVDALTLAIKEFWPDLRKKLSKRK
jgi:hypothetical protein